MPGKKVPMHVQESIDRYYETGRRLQKIRRRFPEFEKRRFEQITELDEELRRLQMAEKER